MLVVLECGFVCCGLVKILFYSTWCGRLVDPTYYPRKYKSFPTPSNTSSPTMLYRTHSVWTNVPPIRNRQLMDSTRLCFQMNVIYEMTCNCGDSMLDRPSGSFISEWKNIFTKPQNPTLYSKTSNTAVKNSLGQILAIGTDAVNLQIKEERVMRKKVSSLNYLKELDDWQFICCIQNL